MNICYKILNSLKTIQRIRYLCMKPKSLLETNCGYSDPRDTPRSIITWNVQGLFYFMNPYKQKKIIETIDNFTADVICLQEVFEDSLKQDIIDELEYKYPYYLLGNTHKKYKIGEDSGLLVLSKYKIEYKKEIIFEDCLIPDSFSNKSVLYFSIGCYNFATTHLQSSNMIETEYITINQIKKIMKESPFNNYIICGDLNNTEGFIHTKCIKDDYVPTLNRDILDYIFCINMDVQLTTKVLEIDVPIVSDHKPLLGKLKKIESIT